MNHVQNKKKLIRQVCLTVLLCILPLVYLGFLVPLRYIFVGVVFIIVCILLLRHRVKKEEKVYSSIFDKVFEPFQRTKPSLEIRSSYGFPHFTITFRSEEDMSAAEAGGHLHAFKCTINDLCSRYGDKRNRFDVERAVHATYVGDRYF
jgi:hypothetical protein